MFLFLLNTICFQKNPFFFVEAFSQHPNLFLDDDLLTQLKKSKNWKIQKLDSDFINYDLFSKESITASKAEEKSKK